MVGKVFERNYIKRLYKMESKTLYLGIRYDMVKRVHGFVVLLSCKLVTVTVTVRQKEKKEQESEL